MIVLDSNIKFLEVLLLGSITTNQLDVTCVYSNFDLSKLSVLESVSLNLRTNNTTSVKIALSPPLSSQNTIQEIIISNTDTVSQTVIIRVNDGTNHWQICSVLLNPNDTLIYNNSIIVTDSNGAKKIVFVNSNYLTKTGTINNIRNGFTTLVSGTKFVPDISITSNSIISPCAVGSGSGIISYTTTPSSGFTIISSAPTDTRKVTYIITELS